MGLTGLDNARHDVLGRPERRRLWPAATLFEPVIALGLVPLQPLVSRLPGDAVLAAERRYVGVLRAGFLHEFHLQTHDPMLLPRHNPREHLSAMSWQGICQRCPGTAPTQPTKMGSM